MDNITVFESINKILKNKINICKSAIAIALALSLPFISGCSKKIKDYSISEIIHALNESNYKTTLDENMLNGLDGQSIKEIEKEFKVGYENKNNIECNNS